MRDEMGDFVQTVLYNVLGNKEENTKEKDLEEITDTSYTQEMEATPLSSADADFIKKLRILKQNAQFSDVFSFTKAVPSSCAGSRIHPPGTGR